MAWENAVLEDFTTGNITGNIDTISTVINPQSKQAGSTDYYENFGYIASFNQSNYINAIIDDRAIIFGSLELGLSIIRTSDGFISLQYPYYADEQFIEYRTLKNWSRSAINMYSSEQHNCSIFCTINEDTHKGTIIAYSIDFNSGYWSRLDHSVSYASELTNSELAYNIIKANEYVQYNWQSVPSVSGKNGILQPLSTLVNINDGNPVSGASASAVNIIPASVVSGMIQTGASDVIVSFEIPQLTSGTYDSIKLVGKRGGIPRSKTDGEFIETLSDSDTSKTLTGLTKGYTYWFVIFAEDSKGSSSESDPYPYETGEGESIVFFEVDLGQGGKDIVRYDATKTIGGHKQGELYGSYTISNDELNASDNIAWAYDGSENPKSIPANCTLTFEYDTYFTSGEGYLDWYIFDANGQEQIYWCFDTQYAFQSNKWYNCKTVAKVENGKITRYKYVLDDVELSCGTANIKMPCTDASDSVGIEDIHFRLTRPTKMKNISIYYDFSTYTDGGGGGGSGSGASGSNPVS